MFFLQFLAAEQHTDDTKQPTMYDFLLVFYSNLRPADRNPQQEECHQLSNNPLWLDATERVTSMTAEV